MPDTDLIAAVQLRTAAIFYGYTAEQNSFTGKHTGYTPEQNHDEEEQHYYAGARFSSAAY